MTATVHATAAHRAPAGVAIESATSTTGPPAIQGEADGHAALPGLLEMAHTALSDGVDAIVIACFDDTGIDACRAALSLPVFGIGQCAFLMAQLVGRRFSVVTTLPVSLPVIERNLDYAGASAACVSVVASGVPVLALEAEPEASSEQVSRTLASVIAHDRPGAIVLGCAGMAPLVDRLEREHGLPVIEGVDSAVQLVTAVGRLRAGRSWNR